MPAKKKSQAAPTVKKISVTRIAFRLRGTSALILNRMPEKARLALLAGAGPRKLKGSGSLKHDPNAEFRSSMQMVPGLYPDTDLVFPAVAFKNAMGTAAIYADDVNKTDIRRLIYIPNEWIPIYGVPRMRLDVMRQAGMARTPDIRTRATIREWWTEFELDYLSPLSESVVATLLSNAGVMCGVGDSRQELGKGSFGTWELASDQVPKTLRNIEAQRAAIEDPRPYQDDRQSIELMEMFRAEAERRK